MFGLGLVSIFHPLETILRLPLKLDFKQDQDLVLTAQVLKLETKTESLAELWMHCNPIKGDV